MTFRSGRYHKNRARFHSCAKCSKEFSENEVIFKRRRVRRIKKSETCGYVCRDCYNKLFFLG